MRMRTLIQRWFTGVAFSLATVLVPATAHGILFGVGTHFINYPHAQPLLLDLAQKVGFNSVRANPDWSEVESEKGVYKIPTAWDQFVDRARQRGMEPLLLLAYGNKLYDHGKLPRSEGAIKAFARYAAFVALHFRGKVTYYEIWNEWNTGTGGYYPGGSAQAYARLFDAAYRAIKRVAPNSVVLVSSGYKDWYEKIAKLGVAARADGVAIHPYVAKEFGYNPLVGSNGAERSVQHVMNVENNMRRLSGGKEIPLYITEIGWPTNTGKDGYPQSDVGALAARSLLMFAALPYVKGVWWYDLIDDGADPQNPEDRFGLFTRHYDWKPAAKMLRHLAAFLKHNNLSWNPASDLQKGIVIINRNSTTNPSVLAWHVPPPSGNSQAERSRYVMTCAKRRRDFQARPASAASGALTSTTPSTFTYRDGRCVVKPFFNL